MHAAKHSWIPFVAALSVAVAASGVHGQPIRVDYVTIEARIGQAEHVVVGTIDNVARNVIVAPGAKGKDGSIDFNGQIEYTLTVKAREVLKGNLKDKIDDLAAIHSLGYDKRYEEWSKANTSFLWFLEPAPKVGEKRQWSILPLDKPVPAENGSRREPPVFSMDFTLLKETEVILARAKAYAKNSKKIQATHTIEMPGAIGGGSGGWTFLTVPVEPTLEERAKRLIATPQDFVSAGKNLDRYGRSMLRFGGVTSLRYFKSIANASLLQSLLNDPAENEVKIRAKAFEILLHWGAEVSLPESAQEIRLLELAGTNVTDRGLKQVAQLQNLKVLYLEDTKVTDKGLKELASLKKLTRLQLSESQLSDANLRALREIGLIHTLSQASAGRDKEPKSIDDLDSLSLCRTPITDAGLRELATCKNLTWLDLRDTRVTDAGLKELAGLKNLATLLVRDTRVTQAGAAELKKALPNCEIRRTNKLPGR